jgi:TRAP-type C4-dicarboxylate transport system permease small subunit
MGQSAVGRIGRALGVFEEYALYLITLQMGLSIFIQVVMRYVFFSAITWLDELVHIEVIMLTFFGASLGVKYGSHIAVDVLKNQVKKEPFRSLLEALTHLVLAVYVGFLVYYGMNLYVAMSKFTHFTPALRIPKHYLYLLVCIALGIIVVRSLTGFIQALRPLAAKRAAEVKP